jgi:predicted transcriptional regulator of viral defense system
VLDTAEEQWGLVTRRQIQSAGVAWSTVSRLIGTGALERYAHGVYRLHGAPPVDHLDLRAAWLQLDPATPAWQRRPESGVVSHRSAATVYGYGDLPADVHEFTLPIRRQSRRNDVRLHRLSLAADDWEPVAGLPVTRPHRIVADLLADGHDLGAVAEIAASALRDGRSTPDILAETLSGFAARYGLHDGDGDALLAWLLDLANPEPDSPSSAVGGPVS